MRAVLLTCLFSVLQTAFIYAQPSKYYFDHLGTNEGLSCNSITNIIQDNTGYIWIATIDGLNRYDGARFKIFRNNSSDEKSSSVPV